MPVVAQHLGFELEHFVATAREQIARHALKKRGFVVETPEGWVEEGSPGYDQTIKTYSFENLPWRIGHV